MLEWFVSSAILLSVLIALHYLLRGKVSPKLQYALWALALVRLLAAIFRGAELCECGKPRPRDAALRPLHRAAHGPRPPKPPRRLSRSKPRSRPFRYFPHAKLPKRRKPSAAAAFWS